MNCSLISIFPSLPGTKSGQAVLLGNDPKGNTFLYTNGNSVFIRNIDDPSICDVYTEHSTTVLCAKYAPSGYHIASADQHGMIRIWNAKNREHLSKNVIKPTDDCIKDLAWTPDNQKILIGVNGKEKFGQAFTADTGNIIGEIVGMRKAINSVDFKPTRPFRAITGSEDNSVSFFDVPSTQLKTTLLNHEKSVYGVQYCPDGEKFASSSADGRVFLYDGKSGEKKSELGLPAHTGNIYGLCGDPTSQYILTTSDDNTAKIWDVKNRNIIRNFAMGCDLKDQQVGCLWQGNHIITISLSGYINYLDKNTLNAPIRVIKGHNRSITAMTVLRNSQDVRIFSASCDGIVSILFPLLRLLSDKNEQKGSSAHLLKKDEAETLKYTV
ncbi:unnamed protein product [Didymodactylos carnosus]|uniref:Uncharacterized protein n=1 Tax=Didymodactylos carnosus TaxID=1234261 RepID=A0A8S2EZW9_9BILA|nr:unnamed protein product [Didymodactylos carnosus]CAF4105421.1 unnamed protein product [Didymodactylos carnosus]